MDIKSIQKSASNMAAYQRGVEYFQKNMVRNCTKEYSEILGTTLVYADVKGDSGEEYHVEIDINDVEEIEDYDCTCMAFERFEGGCKHIVATLLYCFSQYFSPFTLQETLQERKNPQKLLSDHMAKILIGKYMRKNQVEIEAEGLEQAQVRMIPKLTIKGKSPYLSITIGNKRQYVVKNIENFCLSMHQGEEYSYGKDLLMYHNIATFEESAKPLVSFLMSRYEELESYKSTSYRLDVDYGYDNHKRQMRLSPMGIDLFFELFLNDAVAIEFLQVKEEKFKVREENPIIDVKISKNSDGSYRIESTPYHCIAGQEYLYLAKRKLIMEVIEPGMGESGAQESDMDFFLWKCDKIFSKKMKDFMEIMGSCMGNLTVSAYDMPDFCGNVISELGNHLKVVGDLQSFSAFIPKEPNTKIYLDSPRPDMITAIVHCEYDGYIFDLMKNAFVGEAKPGKNVLRDKKAEHRIRFIISRYFENYDKKQEVLFLTGNNDEIYDFVNFAPEELAKVGEILATEKYKNIGMAPPPKLSVGVSLESDLLKIVFDLEKFPPSDLMDALGSYKLKKRYHRLKNGTFIKLKDDEFEEILQLVEGLQLKKSDIKEGNITLPRYRALYLDGTLKHSNSIKFERDGNFKTLIRSIKAVEDSEYEVPTSINATLRDYQKVGFQWLKTMSSNGFSGILADDMGLGKTLQMITLLVDGKQQREKKQEQSLPASTEISLVVCPASLVLNWEKEIEKFAPQLHTLTIVGSAAERRQRIANRKNYDVLVTSYDLLRRDLEHYQNVTFEYQIIDEAHYIKNYSTKNAKAVKEIKSVHRFALSGTPVENRLSEIWSIFDFLMPGYLYSYGKFREYFEAPIIKDHDETKLELLKKQVMPFMLRRLKSTVLKELPEKMETVIYAGMESEQEKLYMANLAKAKLEVGKKMNDGNFENNKFAVLALLTRLRQLCCHPALCYEGYEHRSGKLDTCMELITEAVLGGHKILVFSQFVSMLEIIEQSLLKENIAYYKLTGATGKERRAELVEEFNQNQVPVFLISLKAGGTGLNLTGADMVIHYDPWWNIGAQNQATDRTHRIGQTKKVQVYKIITKGTLEEKILKLQESKKSLVDAIVTENESFITSMTPEDLMELLST